MKRNLHNLQMSTAREKQRFSIRKLTIGAASVLLGTTFLFGAGQTVQADTTQVGEQTQAVQQTESIPKSSSGVKVETANNEKVVSEQKKNTDQDNENVNSPAENSTEASVQKTETETQAGQVNNSQPAKSKDENSGESREETTTFTPQKNQQPIAKTALKESKVATPAKQVQATLNIYDYDDVDPSKSSDEIQGGEIDFTYTGTFDEGTLRDSIQKKMDSDLQKQFAYTKYGELTVKDKDGKFVALGVSPVVHDEHNGNIIGGYYYRVDGQDPSRVDGRTDKYTYTAEQKDELVKKQNEWLAYKKQHFELAGYKLAADEDQEISLDDQIQNGQTYNIYVHHIISGPAIRANWVKMSREVDFKYYYNKGDKDSNVLDPKTQKPLQVTKNGYYNDGSYNATQPSLTKTLGSIDKSTISDANSYESRIVSDIPEDGKTKNSTYVIHDVLVDRYFDNAVGLICSGNSITFGQLSTFTNESDQTPSGTVLFEGEPVTQIANWHTFDDPVPDTGKENNKDLDTYSTNNGGYYLGTGSGVTPIGNPATTVVYYYHDQPVDVTFEDVTNGDQNATILSKFDAKDLLRVDKNSAYIPGRLHKTPAQKRKNKNPHQEKYSYQADENTYTAQAINVDPKGTLKSTKTLNYADVLKAYTDNGYVLVSSDPDDLTYDVDKVYDNKRNLLTQHRVIKLAHKVIAHFAGKIKTATRTIHYVAISQDGKQLKGDTTQKVTYTGTYFTDFITGKRVNAKKDANGDWIVDPSNKPVPEISWPVTSDDLTKDQKSFAKVDTPATINITDDEAKTRNVDAGDWYLESQSGNGEVAIGDPNDANWTDKLADGYLVYKQKAQYNIHYIDVNGIDDQNSYSKGKELTDHEVKNVGSEKNTYVGDTPNATASLWTPADYEKAGYVLVGTSDNAKDDQLGKQKLTKGVQDQYVYLKHKAVLITSKTDPKDIPAKKDGSKVDPSTLTKTAIRTIHYVTDDNKTLLPDTTQTITYEGSEYVDAVTGEVVSTTEITDSNGQKVTVAATTPGTTTWKATAKDGSTVDKDGASFNEVTKPVVTNGNEPGTWTTTDEAAKDSSDLDPAGKDFKSSREVTLKYTKDVNADIVYIDDTTGEKLTDVTPDADKHGKTGNKITFAQDPQTVISNYEKSGYVLVRDDFGKGQTYGKDDSHFEVHFVHGTTTTPTAKTPADQKKDVTKTVKRVINYLDAETGQPVAKQVTQTVTYSRTPVYDAVDGNFVGYAKLDAKGQPVVDKDGRTEIDPTLTDENSWVATSSDKDYPVVDSPDLTEKGYEKSVSFSKDTNKGDAAQTTEAKATPDKDGDTVNIYYFHAHDTKTETQTVSRDIYYRGTKDGGKTYQDVDGLANKDKPQTQTVTFTRTQIIDKVTKKPIGYDTDGDGKVDTQDPDKAWVTDKDSFDEIKSPTPSSKGYDKVDKNVPAQTGIKPTDKFDPVVVTYSTNKINADITYWDITNGEDKKIKIGATVGADDPYGNTGDEIHFNSNASHITDLEKQGYVLVKSDFAQGDKYGKEDSHFNVYLKHGISTTPTNKTQKAEVKSETTSQTRTISYVDAATGKKINDELKEYGIKATVPDITQTVDYIRVPLYDLFNGSFLGFAALETNEMGLAKFDVNGKPIIKKDADGNPIISKDEKSSWVPTGTTTKYPEQGSPDLTKYGFKKESSLEQKTNKDNGSKVDAQTADPTKTGGHIDVYYFHDQKDVSHDTPEYKIDQKDIQKTFTRTIEYRGTKDGGKTYEAVNGSPDGKSTYTQTITYTRQAIIDAVTKKVLSYTDWKATDNTVIPKVDSKSANGLGYDNVDTPTVKSLAIDPNSDKTDLGKVVVTYRTNKIGADITYWDITNGEDKKTKIGDTVNADDPYGNTGDEIHFNNNASHIADLEKQGYVLVKSDFKSGDKYGKEDSHFNVYLKHGLSTTPTNKTQKAEVKTETTSQTRTISYVDAATGKKINDELKEYGIKATVPDITQTVDYIRVPLYDLFNGSFFGFAEIETNEMGFAMFGSDGKPIIKRDANGNPIVSKDEKSSWVPTGKTTKYPEQGSPDLTKYGFKKESSLDQKTNKDNGSKVDAQTADPTKAGGHVDVYYFHEQKSVPYNDPEFKFDKQEVEKTFTRTIEYRGTKDGGKTYEAVNGSPDGKSTYTQTITFTRQAIIDAVTKKVLSYTDWTPTKSTMAEVDSKKPGKVGYDKVDVETIEAMAVDPDSDKTDLGKVVVTYSSTPAAPDNGNTGDNGNGNQPGKPENNGSKTPGKSNDNKSKQPKKNAETKPSEKKEPKNSEEKKTDKKTSNKVSEKKSSKKDSAKKSDKKITKKNSTKKSDQKTVKKNVIKKVSKKTSKKSVKKVNKRTTKASGIKRNEQSKILSTNSTERRSEAARTAAGAYNNAPHGENWNENNAPKGEGWNNNNAPKAEGTSANVMPKATVANHAGVGVNGVNSAASENTLPQTGEETTNAYAMGLVALSFASLLSIFGLDHKKKKN